MFKKFQCLSVLMLCMLSAYAQKNIEDYAGIWKGKVEKSNPFSLAITIKKHEGDNASFIIANKKEILRQQIKLKDTLIIQLSEKLIFKGIMNSEHSVISGFIKIGYDFYPIELHKENKSFQGKWNLAANYYLQAESLYLNIVKFDEPDEGFMAYPKLGTFWVTNCKIENNTISFEDYKTGLLFKGELYPSKIEITVSLGTIELSQISYYKKEKNLRSKNENTRIINDGWENYRHQLTLPQLEKDIGGNVLEGVESVLVAQNGELRYESYFGHANAVTPNDLRSAGKSISSALIGIAIDEGIIESTQEEIYKYLPKKYQYTKDEQKGMIQIKDLLTMSSGIGVYEEDYQESDNWLKMVLEPKLKYAPGEHTNYMSADPFLLGVYLSERLSYPLEFYIQKKLFSPLGITNYILNTDDKGVPYFAGGLKLTPRDMLKFGQLYLNKGVWEGKRIISEAWVEESFKKHTRLENTSGKNEYTGINLEISNDTKVL